MSVLNSKKVKFIIKFQISSGSTSLDTKMNTVLAQRRINSSDFFNFFKNKILELKIKEGIKLTVFILVFEFDDYIVYIKMPSLTNIINKCLYLDKNFYYPGYLYNKKTNDLFFYYILTPYILYEIVQYKYNYENFNNLSFFSFYKKHISSLKSKGINLYIC